MGLRPLLILALPGLLAAQSAIAAPGADFHTLAKKCAGSVESNTLASIVNVESGFNPYAIGVVGGRLERQPASKEEAVATAKALEASGLKFSAGMGQVFRGNWAAFGLNSETVFDPCGNLKVSASIFESCHIRAKAEFSDPTMAKSAAHSCYYSNNFKTGFTSDFPGQPSYVEKIRQSAAKLETQAPPVVQAIRFIPSGASAPVSTNATAPAPAPAAAAPAQAKPQPAEIVVFDQQLEQAPPVVVAPAQPPTTVAAAPAQAPAEAPEQQTEPVDSPYVYSPNSTEQGADSALVY